ncbi:hypothetical protein [Sulfurihydrogenibium sp.]|uniref:hypothetical protein n=1 Tax=Sulfurihydrogenibium sp. TaxID=2053621 RepID=UPI002634FF65|nr:hypothetical protein [Sulfurihydrogenibium sp.]
MINSFEPKKLTFKNYFLAVVVLFLFGIAILVSLVAIPYLLFLILKIIFISIEFTILFILVFWLMVVILLWIIKLSKLM